MTIDDIRQRCQATHDIAKTMLSENYETFADKTRLEAIVLSMKDVVDSIARKDVTI